MGYRLKFILLVAFCVAAPLRAADSGEVVVGQDAAHLRKIGDTVCISGAEGRARCGRVVRADEKQATVRLNLLTKGVEMLGDTEETPKPVPKKRAKKKAPPPVVQAAPEPAPAPAPPVTPREPATKEIVEAVVAPAATTPFGNISLGLGAGGDYGFLMAHCERRVSETTSFGVLPFYSRGGGGISSVGAYATGTFALDVAGLPRLHLQSGVGYFAISHLGRTGASLALSELVAWRRDFESGWNLLVGAGGQYLVRLSGDPAQIDFTGLRPYFQLAVGHSF